MHKKSSLEKSLDISARLSLRKRRLARSFSETILRLPDDPTRVEQLRQKFVEYQARRDESDKAWKHQTIDEAAKYFMLGVVLSGHETTVAEVWDDFKRTNQTPVRHRFKAPEVILGQWVDGSSVIIDYIQTGGQNNKGGSGLPSLQ